MRTLGPHDPVSRRGHGALTTVADRLSSLDVSFLYMEGRTTPMHVGGLLVFENPHRRNGQLAASFDYDRLVRLIEERIALVPRYRQKIRTVPGHLAYPVWIDDPEFDITFHVRRSALPKPGSDEQLREFCARIQSRPLDRHRPLWEIYLVEGLRDDRIAIITKTHHAMVDGVSAIDIGQVILDPSPQPREVPEDLWMPEPEPSSLDLVFDAVRELVRRPAAAIDTVRLAANDVRATGDRVLGALGGLAAAARMAVRPAPEMPLNAQIGQQRRYGTAHTSLADHKRIRALQVVAGRTTINDIVLATVAGALRGWLLFRGESVTPSTTVRAMVPVSVRSDSESGTLGNRISALFVDLPVGEPDPVMRLAQVSYAMRGHKESGQSVGADALVALSGFAPPTLHALGARAANGLTRRLFNLVVTNVPGPQFPLYAAGARLLEIFPIVPLAEGQAVTIGLTSYDGGVYYGLNADREAMPDVDVLAALLEESLAELLAASELVASHRESAGASDLLGGVQDATRTTPPAAATRRGRQPAKRPGTTGRDARTQRRAEPHHRGATSPMAPVDGAPTASTNGARRRPRARASDSAGSSSPTSPSRGESPVPVPPSSTASHQPAPSAVLPTGEDEA
jgi:diacylglycerol O-acyltransferase / wax synthase